MLNVLYYDNTVSSQFGNKLKDVTTKTYKLEQFMKSVHIW